MKKKRLNKSKLIKFTPVIILAFIVAAVGVKLLIPSHAEPAGFIYTSGTKMMLNGTQYRFIGSDFGAMVAGACGPTASQSQMDAYFSKLPTRSMTRVFAPSGTSLSAMDMMVASATSHNQYLTIALGDQGGGCDPLPRSSGFYSGGYKGAYYNWINQVVPRYKNDTAVAIWELVNEGDGSAVQFYADTSTYIRSLDPNHLISTGAAGFDDSDNYVNIHSVPNINLISEHEYDDGTGLSHWDLRCAQVANQINKPCYLGEYGFPADYGSGNHVSSSNAACMSYSQRASWVTQKAQNFMANASISGAMIWTADTRSFSSSDCQLNFGPDDPVYSALRAVTGYANGSATPGGGTTTTPTPTPAATPTPTPTPDPSGEVSYDDNVTGTGTDQFNYIGSGWNTSSDTSKYGGSDHYDSTTNDTVTFKFTGTRASIYGAKADYYGNASFSVDGSTATTVDLYASSRIDNTLLWSTPTLAAGTHTITVKVLGTQDPSSSNTIISIDRAGVVPSSGTATPTPTPTSSCPITGDVNCDNHVTSLDLAILLSNWNKQSGATHAQGDLSGDGKVTSLDLAIILSNWGK